MNNKTTSKVLHNTQYYYLVLTLQIRNGLEIDDAILEEFKKDPLKNAKISAKEKLKKLDNRDPSKINGFKNVKIAMPYGDGSVIFRGNIEIDFRDGPHGQFYCTDFNKVGAKVDTMNGVDFNLKFASLNDVPTELEAMDDFFQHLDTDPRFVFSIRQFDDFMKVFEFYKEISAELNNNVNYPISSISAPYYFITADVDLEENDIGDDAKEVYDDKGILIGYCISQTTYQYKIRREDENKVHYLIDLVIKDADKGESKSKKIDRIRRIGEENIYVSNLDKITEKNSEDLTQFFISNIRVTDDSIVLSGEFKDDADYDKTFKFLNLYDMGQKIKIDSIDESLRLINQGATGSAAELLSYLIGDEKDMPRGTKVKVTEEIKPYLQGLNESQQKAFLMAVDGAPVSLIKGPPGTGKTHVINAIVRYITKALGQHVIVSSQTHVAIDNVLDKLMENKDIVIPQRITNRKNRYSNKELDMTLYQTWGQHFEEFNREVSNQKLSALMEKSISKFNGDRRFMFTELAEQSDYSVIGATTTTSAIAGRSGYKVLNGFDWLIIDEVSKCPITEVLRYLPYVNKIIMVGDDYQLAPLLEFKESDFSECECYKQPDFSDRFKELEKTYEDSVFAKVMDKAKKSGRVVLLNENYRSVKDILSVYNVFYSGELKGCREMVRPETVHFTDSVLDNHDVFFIEVLHGQEVIDTKKNKSRYNLQEIEATKYYLELLLQTTINPHNITVSAIFPYAAQIERFQKTCKDLINEAKKTFKSFEIDTVDAFQGKESDIILCDTVVANSSSDTFLSDFRRINVSMSRARDKLFIFGNSKILSQIDMYTSSHNKKKYFADIIDYIKSQETKRGKYIVYKGGK